MAKKPSSRRRHGVDAERLYDGAGFLGICRTGDRYGGLLLHFLGGTGGTQAAIQAAKWTGFPYLSMFQAARRHFYIFFLPDRFIYFQHRIPIGFIPFAFSRSRPKKFRRRLVVTSSCMDLGTAGGVLGGTFSRLSLFYFISGNRQQILQAIL